MVRKMKITTRTNTFETNSSSTHAILSDEEFEEWQNGDKFLGFFGDDNSVWKLLEDVEEQDLWKHPYYDENGVYCCGWMLSRCSSELLDNDSDYDNEYAIASKVDNGWEVEVVVSP